MIDKLPSGTASYKGPSFCIVLLSGLRRIGKSERMQVGMSQNIFAEISFLPVQIHIVIVLLDIGQSRYQIYVRKDTNPGEGFTFTVEITIH